MDRENVKMFFYIDTLICLYYFAYNVNTQKCVCVCIDLDSYRKVHNNNNTIG